MAVKPCKECGHSVSDKAESCPSCGVKIQKGVPRWAVWLVFLFVFAAIVESCSEMYKSSAENRPIDTNSTTAIVEESSNWNTSVSNDEMRGTKSKTTYNISKNSVNFGFPYNGGSKLYLYVMNKAGKKEIMIEISKGQFVCGVIDNCEVNFKFDDGAVKSISMIGSDSHDSDILFVNYSKTTNSLIEKMKTSKKLIIEPNFYQEGTKQFTFELKGFTSP